MAIQSVFVVISPRPPAAPLRCPRPRRTPHGRPPRPRTGGGGRRTPPWPPAGGRTRGADTGGGGTRMSWGGMSVWWQRRWWRAQGRAVRRAEQPTRASPPPGGALARDESAWVPAAGGDSRQGVLGRAHPLGSGEARPVRAGSAGGGGRGRLLVRLRAGRTRGGDGSAASGC